MMTPVSDTAPSPSDQPSSSPNDANTLAGAKRARVDGQQDANSTMQHNDDAIPGIPSLPAPSQPTSDVTKAPQDPPKRVDARDTRENDPNTPAAYFGYHDGSDFSFLTGALAGIGGMLKSDARAFIVEELARPEDQLEDDLRQQVHARIARGGLNTRDVMQMLSKAYTVNEKQVGYAGLKDKNAWTVQTFSMQRKGEQMKTAEAFAEHFQTKLASPTLRLEQVWFKQKMLHQGQLRGNKFRILIADLGCDLDEAMSRCIAIRDELVKRGGFANYFGVQRLGKNGQTANAGARHVLMSRAVRLEDKLAQQSDAETAADVGVDGKVLPTWKSKKRKVMSHKRDKRLSPWLLRFRINAFQSLLYNQWLSRRIERDMYRVLDGEDRLMKPDGETSVNETYGRKRKNKKNKNNAVDQANAIVGTRATGAGSEACAISVSTIAGSGGAAVAVIATPGAVNDTAAAPAIVPAADDAVATCDDTVATASAATAADTTYTADGAVQTGGDNSNDTPDTNKNKNVDKDEKMTDVLSAPTVPENGEGRSASANSTANIESIAETKPEEEPVLSFTGPLFGSVLDVSAGVAGELETELFREYDLDASDFDAFGVDGGRRPARIPLDNFGVPFSIEAVPSISDYFETLGEEGFGPVRTETTNVKSDGVVSGAAGGTGVDVAVNREVSAATVVSGGILFTFALPKGCYATSMLREFTKNDQALEVEEEGKSTGRGGGDGGGRNDRKNNKKQRRS